MLPEKLPYRELPTAMKVVLWLFAAHIVLYLKAVADAVIHLGQEIHPMWVLHLGVAFFIFSEVARPRKGMFYVVLGYSLIMPTVMLKNNLVPVFGTPAFIPVLIESLYYCIPLYLMAPFAVARRSFYKRKRTASTVHNSVE